MHILLLQSMTGQLRLLHIACSSKARLRKVTLVSKSTSNIRRRGELKVVLFFSILFNSDLVNLDTLLQRFVIKFFDYRWERPRLWYLHCQGKVFCCWLLFAWYYGLNYPPYKPVALAFSQTRKCTKMSIVHLKVFMKRKFLLHNVKELLKL